MFVKDEWANNTKTCSCRISEVYKKAQSCQLGLKKWISKQTSAYGYFLPWMLTLGTLTWQCLCNLLTLRVHKRKQWRSIPPAVARKLRQQKKKKSEKLIDLWHKSLVLPLKGFESQKELIYRRCRKGSPKMVAKKCMICFHESQYQFYNQCTLDAPRLNRKNCIINYFVEIKLAS